MHKNYDDAVYLLLHDEEEQLIVAQQKLHKNRKTSERIRYEKDNETKRAYEM